MIVLYTKVKDLVDLLAQAEELPSVDIYLRETHASWSSDGKPHKSIIVEDDENGDDDDYDPDFEVILMLFCRLRDVRNSRIYTQDCLLTGNWLPENITRGMELREPFGKVRDGSAWDDDKVQERLEVALVRSGK